MEQIYYRIIGLNGTPLWSNQYNGYEVYIPNTIHSIGSRWICDWKSTANIHYDGTYDEWKKISKDSEWYALMSIRLFCKDKLICTRHDYGDYIIEKKPTDTENGLKYRICKYCGNRENATIQKFQQSSNFYGATTIDSTSKTITIHSTVDSAGVAYKITELQKRTILGI